MSISIAFYYQKFGSKIVTPKAKPKVLTQYLIRFRCPCAGHIHMQWIWVHTRCFSPVMTTVLCHRIHAALKHRTDQSARPRGPQVSESMTTWTSLHRVLIVLPTHQPSSWVNHETTTWWQLSIWTSIQTRIIFIIPVECHSGENAACRYRKIRSELLAPHNTSKHLPFLPLAKLTSNKSCCSSKHTERNEEYLITSKTFLSVDVTSRLESDNTVMRL